MAVDAKTIAKVLALSTALAIPAEGLYTKYYFDPPGILSVCYGYTGKDIDKSKTYTLAECKALLNKDMLNALNIVDQCAPGAPPQVLAAFTDLTYNAGPTAACDVSRSTAARLLAAKDYRGACDQLPRWDKSRVAGVMVSLPGLTKRRAAERELCLKGLE
jgi:GH24 family phage-related lysozyme (muramidase)